MRTATERENGAGSLSGASHKWPFSRGKVVKTGLGKDVDEALAKTETISGMTREVQRKMRITWGEKGKGSYTKRDPINTIYIDENLKGKPETVARILSHEIGHYWGDKPYEDPRPGQSKEGWIAEFKQMKAGNEGLPKFLEYVAFRESNGEIPQLNNKYESICERYYNRALKDSNPKSAFEDPDMKREIGEIYRSQVPSTRKKSGELYKNYDELWSIQGENVWNYNQKHGWPK